MLRLNVLTEQSIEKQEVNCVRVSRVIFKIFTNPLRYTAHKPSVALTAPLSQPHSRVVSQSQSLIAPPPQLPAH